MRKSGQLIILIFLAYVNETICAFNIKLKLHPASTVDDQESTKEEGSDGARGELSNQQKTSQGNTAFKKKGPRGSNMDKKTEGVPELLRGVSFCITRWTQSVPQVYVMIGSICLCYL